MRRATHLRRLAEVWQDDPIYFITTCAADREEVLAADEFHAVALEVWRNCERLYGWSVGRYVLMPDHVHFFCFSPPGAKSLSLFVGKWKEWTAKYAAERLGVPSTLWQTEFFDHVLRAWEGYNEKWQYVRDNPVRRGLVADPDEWRYQGELNLLEFE
jgi:REP element-mobilizing transposase RayT